GRWSVRMSSWCHLRPLALSLLFVTLSGTRVMTTHRAINRTGIRTSDRNHLVTLCQFVSMFVKALLARRNPRQFKALRQCRQWRERLESHKKTQCFAVPPTKFDSRLLGSCARHRLDCDGTHGGAVVQVDVLHGVVSVVVAHTVDVIILHEEHHGHAGV